MQMVLEQKGEARIVRVRESKLTYPVLSSFLAGVRSVIDDGARDLVIDMEAVTYIDSATIGCLVEIHNLVEDRGGTMTLAGLHRRVETMLTMTGVSRFMEVSASV